MEKQQELSKMEQPVQSSWEPLEPSMMEPLVLNTMEQQVPNS